MNLETIAQKASEDFLGLIKENTEDLEHSITKAAEESQLQETPLKFTIGIKLTLDLDKSKQTLELSWSDKHRRSCECDIEDPNQPKLGIED